jgi:hypothetical protein
VAEERRFSRRLLAAIGAAKYMKIRSGEEHQFIWIWVVVVGDRVFVRSWNDKRTGWHRAFLDEPRGAIEIDGREVRIRAVTRRGERLMRAIEQAYADKYTTPGALRYVKGFRRPRRRLATLELVPR